MQIKFNIHEKYKQPEIVICNYELSDEIRQLADTVAQAVDQRIIGYTSDGAVSLRLSDVIRIYAQNQRVLAQTEEETCCLHSKLYELEEKLPVGQFVRISKSEIVNINRIRRLDMSMIGTIKILLAGGIETYVSRRNVSNIKKVLEERGRR